MGSNQQNAPETVLVVGASGNIGVSAIVGALNSKRHVIAIVRNQASADKLLREVETGFKDASKSITLAIADVTSEDGVQSVVDKVKAGSLPDFQHVYATVGVMYDKSPIQDVDTANCRRVVNIAFESNFFAYRATMPYLIEQGNQNATWTLMTGGAGDMGLLGVTGIVQGALFSMANAACLENANTNVRFNEVYLCFRVGLDSLVEKLGPEGGMKASDFAAHYQNLLERTDIRACRVFFRNHKDVHELKYEKKIEGKTYASG